ncbi:Pentatricopeptide repeat-containing protein [Apostasia shenzhenica]|uniref:Pentatricopeptide repeat-containing protein n=1 Tax=Apostasia shenzhenica TaxID=1088818 RepID=A0A2I0A7X9_9ASPA|nr:Pentatricopeptide repeat-containing protein [Apostasia shenzhenica]
MQQWPEFGCILSIMFSLQATDSSSKLPLHSHRRKCRFLPAVIHPSSISCRSHSSSAPKDLLCNYRTPNKIWNSRIKLQVGNTRYKGCLSLYTQKLDEDIIASPTAVLLVLRACSGLSGLRTLRLLHNDILRFKLESRDDISAALLNGYIKCGALETARKLFDEMPHRGVISWTVMISHFYNSGQHREAVCCFRAMLEEGVFPDDVSIISILSAVSQSHSRKHGMEIHGFLIRNCFILSKPLVASLINFYAKLQNMDCAERILRQSGETKNVVALTAMMTGFIKASNFDGALLLYKKIANLGMNPSEKTVSSALKAASHLRFLHLGAQIHGYVIKKQLHFDEFIQTGLIDMYAACFAPTHVCRRIFDQMTHKDVVAWTTLIRAHGLQGEGRTALKVFDEMLAVGIRPDSAAFAAVLSACSLSGLLGEGLDYFSFMIQKYEIKPREEHYASIRSLFSKEGRIEEAYEKIQTIKVAREDHRIWEALLSACKVHGNLIFSEIAARRLLEIEPGNYSATAGKWENGDST